jgi:hypothetical protein
MPSGHVAFLTLALNGGLWSTSLPAGLPPGKKHPGVNLVGGWVGSSANLEAVERRKILPL